MKLDRYDLKFLKAAKKLMAEDPSLTPYVALRLAKVKAHKERLSRNCKYTRMVESESREHELNIKASKRSVTTATLKRESMGRKLPEKRAVFFQGGSTSNK
ncbi:hypothetical protein QQ215_004619 [Vibrio vulnificus]|nr:hypothetical protein [Vibrio vulnificus]ELS0763809.1 hypothetical protein [Vibrio vulnificus]ELV8609765.1 hypothetical protein [Vibrio vulnificus]ELV8618540.1 hypothetical protein [Vibrio vulnificus]